MTKPKKNQPGENDFRSSTNRADDLESYYNNSANEIAFTNLTTALDQYTRLIVLTGESGIGKTLLLHRIMQEAKPQVKYVFSASSQISFEELLNSICDLQQAQVSGLHKLGKINALEYYLGLCIEQNIRIILIIDEAHELAGNVLSDALALAQSIQQNQLPLQIVLSGQPVLEQQLSHQRLAFSIIDDAVYTRLQPLNAAEIPVFINCQLRTANNPYDMIFPARSIESIVHHSHGIPGRIKALCEHALAVHRRNGEHQVAVETIERLAVDFAFSKSDTSFNDEIPNNKKNEQQQALDEEINRIREELLRDFQPTKTSQTNHSTHTNTSSHTQSSAFVSSDESSTFSDVELEQDINSAEPAVKPQQSQSYRRTGRRISVRSLLMASVVAITAGAIGAYATLYIKNNHAGIGHAVDQLGSFVKPATNSPITNLGVATVTQAKNTNITQSNSSTPQPLPNPVEITSSTTVSTLIVTEPEPIAETTKTVISVTEPEPAAETAKAITSTTLDNPASTDSSIQLDTPANDPIITDTAPVPVQTITNNVPQQQNTSIDTGFYLQRGQSLLELGDIASARSFFQAGANAGDGESLMAVGMTYDPIILSQRGLTGVYANSEIALEWYRKALSAGHQEAETRLQELRVWQLKDQ